MVAVAELTVPKTVFPITVSFDSLPGARVELERVVSVGGEPMPHLWAAGADADAVRSALREQEGPPDGDTSVVEEVDHRVLVRTKWDRSAGSLFRGIVETGLTVMTGAVDGDEWRFVVRATDADAISAFGTFCRERDVSFEVHRVGSLSAVARGAKYGLTDAQYEALLLAYEAGYFDSPRRASLSELAAELEISRQAFADRLRRGHRTIVAHALSGRGS